MHDERNGSPTATTAVKPQRDRAGSASAGLDNDKAQRPKEIGGRDGPDPTRYGDWEKGGRCIDF